MSGINTDEYNARYDTESNCIILEGVFRLQGFAEYAPIYEMLFKSLSSNESDELILDIKKLTFLNSSGISVLSKFVIEVRNNGSKKLIINGSKDIPWQGKSLNNLKRLMPEIELNIN